MNKNAQQNENTRDLFTLPRDMAEDKLSKGANQSNLSYAGLQTKYQSLTTGQAGLDNIIKGTNVAVSKIAGLFNKQVEEIQQNKKYIESHQQDYNQIHSNHIVVDQLVYLQKQTVEHLKSQIKKTKESINEIDKLERLYAKPINQEFVLQKLSEELELLEEDLLKQQRKYFYLQFLQSALSGAEISYMRLFISGYELFNANDQKISKANASRKEQEEIFLYTKLAVEDIYSKNITSMLI